jgi:hypothetical protein
VCHTHHEGRDPGALAPAPTRTDPAPTRTDPAPTRTDPAPTRTDPAPSRTDPDRPGNSGGPGAPDLRLGRWLARRSTIRC